MNKFTQGLIVAACTMVLGGPIALLQAQTSQTTIETQVHTNPPPMKVEESAPRPPIKKTPEVTTSTSVETKAPGAVGTTQVTTTKKKGKAAATTTVITKTPAAPRMVYDQKTLEKLAQTKSLCAKGFDAHVGANRKNICGSQAHSPDIAYTCAWREKGPAAFLETQQGPCMLDFTVKSGDEIISKESFKSNPPLKYGTPVVCCLREASGNANMEMSTTIR